MRQVLLPLLLHKGQLHNWQVRKCPDSKPWSFFFQNHMVFPVGHTGKENIVIFVFLLQTRTELFSVRNHSYMLWLLEMSSFKGFIK